jgi:hypothetical protein
MKKLFAIFSPALIACLLLFTSCDDTTTTNELSAEIKNIVPDATLTKITDLGMPIFKGNAPTNLVNYFKASPFVLKASNRSSDNIGSTYSDYVFYLHNQDNAKLSITLDYQNGPEAGTGLGGFISGNGNDFSVFVKVRSTNSSSGYADMIHIISGTMTSTGIKNMYFANFMLDNFGNSGWIANGEGRILYDSDGNSPIVTSLTAKATDNLLGAGFAPGVVIK